MTPDKLQEWPKVVVRPNVTLSHHRLWISHPPTHITSRRLMPGQHTAVCFRMSEFQTPYLFLCAVSLLHIPVDDLRNNGEKRIQLDLVSANAYLSPTPRKGASCLSGAQGTPVYKANHRVFFLKTGCLLPFFLRTGFLLPFI